jgi:hypothetical protein
MLGGSGQRETGDGVQDNDVGKATGTAVTYRPIADFPFPPLYVSLISIPVMLTIGVPR